MTEQLSEEKINKVIEATLGQRLWKDGVYIADSLYISMTVFQLKAIICEAEQGIRQQGLERRVLND